MRPRPAIRTVEVLPPSHADEGMWVFLTASFVCLAVIYIIAFERAGRLGAAGGSAALPELLPFQVLLRDLPSREQRVFRAMQEGVTEALGLRATERAWPTVEALAARNVPPFARDVLDPASLAWTQRRDGLVTEYLGLPAAAGDLPSFLILVQEPAPGSPPDPGAGKVDEEHQRLPDGTLLHVTYWKHAPARAGLVGDPALEGWQQIRIASPFPPLEAP